MSRKGLGPERTRKKLFDLYRRLAEASNPKEISRLQGKVARLEDELKRMGGEMSESEIGQEVRQEEGLSTEERLAIQTAVSRYIANRKDPKNLERICKILAMSGDKLPGLLKVIREGGNGDKD